MGLPSCSRVEDLAKNLRGREIGESRKMIGASHESPFIVEMLSATHGVLTAHHDRVFRTIRLPPPDEIRKLKIQAITIAEVNDNSDTAMVRNFLFLMSVAQLTLYILSHTGGARDGFNHPLSQAFSLGWGGVVILIASVISR